MSLARYSFTSVQQIDGDCKIMCISVGVWVGIEWVGSRMGKTVFLFPFILLWIPIFFCQINTLLLDSRYVNTERMFHVTMHCIFGWVKMKQCLFHVSKIQSETNVGSITVLETYLETRIGLEFFPSIGDPNIDSNWHLSGVFVIKKWGIVVWCFRYSSFSLLNVRSSQFFFNTKDF